MRLYLNDLRREASVVKSKTIPAIIRVISQSSFILGEELALFEKRFASYCGVKYSVGVANGTAALFLALKSLGIGKGDEVITTAISFAATAEAIIHTGARPVLVDVNSDNLLIDDQLIESKITKRTKAILPVHLYGFPANLHKIQGICKKYNLFLVGDCAQAHGATFDYRPIASFGDVACFSFMPAKNLGAYGDAGCVATNNKSIVKHIKILRDHGRADKYRHRVLGYAERMDTLQAAVLNQKLDFVDLWNKRRRDIARQYDSGFKKNGRINVYRSLDNTKPVYYVYVIGLKNRDDVRIVLSKNNIDSGLHYPIPLHLQLAFKYLGYKRGDFPIAELHCKRVLSLPMHPFLKDVEIKKIIGVVNKYAK